MKSNSCFQWLKCFSWAKRKSILSWKYHRKLFVHFIYRTEKVVIVRIHQQSKNVEIKADKIVKRVVTISFHLPLFQAEIKRKNILISFQSRPAPSPSA
jgi:DUF4097 and DUF4098 domain-containing protein YvlB